jgi:protein SCO1/2
MRPVTRAIALISAATVLVGLAVGGYLVMRGAPDDRFADCRRTAVAGGTADIGGPFALTDAAGRRVTEAVAITGPTLIYFGYTFCPDFCPTDLARNAAAADLLAERGVDVGQVFITIDPERDTPEVAGDYASAIHPDLVGLSGTPDEIAAAAKAYRVYFRKSGDDPEYYMMDHSTFSYLVAPDAGLLEFFRSEMTAEEVADATACYVDRL